MKIKKGGVIIIIYAVLMAAVIALIIGITVNHKEEEVLKVGFITTGNVDDRGWNSTNYRCIGEACEDIGAELYTVAGVDEYSGDCGGAVAELVGKGVEVILINSSVLSDQMKDVMERYPEISFYGADANYKSANFASFSSRMYQVRYLSGIVAGKYTKTGRIGFVSAFKDPTAYRNINAFTLGVKSVAPNAEVIVAWTGSWENEELEKRLARELIEKENVDLLTYYQHVPYVIDEAEAHGVASIGYYDPETNVSDKYLTCAMCDWTMVYEKMLKSYLNGIGNSQVSEWLGVESGAMTLSGLSPLVSDETAALVSDARERLVAGWHVFSGEIYDNEGNERCATGESMSDNTLLYEMDWLTEGVREYAY